jgi:hypothetical protein
VKFGRDTIASIVGSVRLSDTLRVRKGWNIIGALSEPVPVEAVRFIPPNLGRGQFFGFERGYLAASVLEPMRAYWVNVSDSGSIILAAVASSAAPKTAVSPAVTAEAASAGVIIVTDAAGGRQRLLLGKGKISAPSLYALPPPGPAGAFDARFGSGTMFETYAGGESPEEFVLRISSASYPVTVSWEMPPSSAERISIAGLATGGAVPMRGGGSMTLTNPAVNSLRIIVDGNSTLPETYSLLQSYPNPFNPTATIRYELPEPALVTITIYDVLGRRVEALVDGQSREAGRFEAVFNGAGRASGVYFYKITAQGQSTRFERVMKMLLLK